MGAIAAVDASAPRPAALVVGTLPGDQADRITVATVACIARWGLAKTTLDDIARAASCSRATVYRTFPGGKERLLAHVVAVEIDRFFGALDDHLGPRGHDLSGLLVEGITFAGQSLVAHPALRYLMAHEPEAVLPLVAFHRAAPVLAAVGARVSPYLRPHIGARADEAGEWLARLVLSYVLRPSRHVDLTDPASVTRLVRRFVLPGLVSQGASNVHQ